MATEVYKNAMLQIGSVNLSAFLRSLTLSYAAESLDETQMGDDSRVHKGGLKDWSLDAEFTQDFVSGGVDGTLFGILGCQTCVEFRPKHICSTVINPRFQGTVLVETYPPAGGAVGDLLMATARFTSAGDLSRNTAAT